MVASIDGEEDTTDSLPDCSSCKEFYAKYEIKEILGRGVSSTVRRCIEKSTHKEYAVKMIDLTQEKDNEELMEEYRQATKKEIQVLKMCAAHPFIIELHDTFESLAFIFLVFELCKTGELFDYLTEVVSLSEKRTRQIMRQLLDAVEFIHSKNIVHRDLKPENILLDDNFNVKLLDFGFASVISHDEELRDLCGTPGYLSPEALKVSMIDNAPGYGKPVDMWASGVIMYTLLSGSPPFWHRKQMIMLRMIMEGKYTFSSPEWEDISEIARDLIAKLLVVEPSERLTAIEALNHPFFKREERQKLEFLPRRKFKGGAFVVIAMNRLKTQHLHPPEISIEDLKENPYRMRNFRKAIDGGAFRIYGHWVKKAENQNRAALFENNIKKDLKVSSSDEQSFNVDQHFERLAMSVQVGDRVGRTAAAATGIAATAAAAAAALPPRGPGTGRRSNDARGAAARKNRAPMLGLIRESISTEAQEEED